MNAKSKNCELDITSPVDTGVELESGSESGRMDMRSEDTRYAYDDEYRPSHRGTVPTGEDDTLMYATDTTPLESSDGYLLDAATSGLLRSYCAPTAANGNTELDIDNAVDTLWDFKTDLEILLKAIEKPDCAELEDASAFFQFRIQDYSMYLDRQGDDGFLGLAPILYDCALEEMLTRLQTCFILMSYLKDHDLMFGRIGHALEQVFEEERDDAIELGRDLVAVISERLAQVQFSDSR
jgi:hypothetical protein